MNLRTHHCFVIVSVTEFVNVWAVGGTSVLRLECQGGQATLSFDCHLGRPGDAHHFRQQYPPRQDIGSLPPSPPPANQRPQHRGPAAQERSRYRATLYQEQHAAGVSQQEVSPSSHSPLPPLQLSSPEPSQLLQGKSWL